VRPCWAHIKKAVRLGSRTAFSLSTESQLAQGQPVIRICDGHRCRNR
jgi:hypothetical protein